MPDLRSLRAPDFGAIAYQLRGLLAQAMGNPTGDGNTAACLALREAVTRAEHEMAVQAILFLADHLVHFEDSRRAALLFAYALPPRLLADPRLQGSLAFISGIVNRQATPDLEVEAARCKLEPSSEEFAFEALRLAPRAYYLLTTARLTRARMGLEYGTGTGTNLLHVGRLDPSIRWIGLDVSPGQIEENRRMLQAILDRQLIPPDQISFAAAPASDLEGRADIVGVLDTLEHTLHPAAVLTEAERYVRPGGTVCVTVPDGPWSLHTPNVLNAGATPGGHVSGYSLGDLVEICSLRGRLLDARSLPGPMPREGNRSACCAYEPALGT